MNRQTQIGKAERPAFILKEKIADMMKYGYPKTMKFCRKHRQLADEIRASMLACYKYAVRLEKKYFKQTTCQDLDIELDTLRHFVRMAADPDFEGPNFAPPLSRNEYRVWSEKLDEIGRLVGGYMDYIRRAQPRRTQSKR